MDSAVSFQAKWKVEPHVAIETKQVLLNVGLLMDSLILQAAIAQLAVVAFVRLSAFKSTLGHSPSRMLGRRLLHFWRLWWLYSN